MNKPVFLSLLFVVGIVLVSGCTQTDTSDTGQVINKDSQPTQTFVPSVPDPENIDVFAGVKEGDVFRFYFAFNDRIAHDGNAKFEIKDYSGNKVYSSTFDAKSNQFMDYQFQLTGSPMGKAYEWKVPYSDIKKGMSSMGTAYIVFTTPSGKSLTADTSLFNIPSYTEEELEQIYESQYEKSAKTSGRLITKGNFQVTLDKYGFFKHSVFGKEETDFRVDIEVKNVGGEQDTFSIYNGAMIVGDQQYDVGFDSDFDGMNIYPSIVKKGYLVFKDVPEDISGEAKVIVGSAWIGYSPANYEFTIDL